MQLSQLHDIFLLLIQFLHYQQSTNLIYELTFYFISIGISKYKNILMSDSVRQTLPRNAQEAPPQSNQRPQDNELTQIIAKGAELYKRLSTNDVLEFKKFTRLNQHQMSSQIVAFQIWMVSTFKEQNQIERNSCQIFLKQLKDYHQQEKTQFFKTPELLLDIKNFLLSSVQSSSGPDTLQARKKDIGSERSFSLFRGLLSKLTRNVVDRKQQEEQHLNKQQ